MFRRRRRKYRSEPLSELEERCVLPYYLKMMGCHAIAHGPGLVDEVASVARSLTDVEIVELLGSAWRPRVMGAWFAPLHDNPAVRSALLASLASSGGALTSPPLAAVAAVLCGSAAVDSLRLYRVADIENQHGAASIIDATIERLGQSPVPGSDVSLARPADRNALEQLVHVVDRLRAA